MSAPPPEVLAAFGAASRPVLLDAGMGVTWRAGDVVLKPVDDETLHAWVCELYAGWTAGAVRVPTPLRSADGAWSHRGWGAQAWLPGVTARAGHDPDRFRACADAFHDALATIPVPASLARRADPWALADRIAFDAAPAVGPAGLVALVERAAAGLRPVSAPAQLVHGDLGGNTLWHDELPPAVIDLSPYHRPRGFALAVAAMDAVCWEGADPVLLDRWADVPEWDQLLLRATIFRVAARGVGDAPGRPGPDRDHRFADRASVDLVLRRVESAA